MLAIGRALMSSPRVLLLDEPSIGLAPALVREVLQLLPRLREEGLTIVLVEQDAVAALRIADRGYVLERGSVAVEGPARELLGTDRVQRAYLGRAAEQPWRDRSWRA
jgi:branched-chain amino acid transport system ATP-binding protein